MCKDVCLDEKESSKGKKFEHELHDPSAKFLRSVVDDYESLKP